jgi:haloalkane dehalogenase
MQISHLQALVQALDLHNVILVGQDWGGPIGAAMAAREESRIQAALFANTILLAPRQPHPLSTFHRLSHIPVLSELLFRGLNFPMPILRRVQGDRRSIDQIAMRAYRYPFPRWRMRAAPLALARMVPRQLDHPSMAGLREGEHWARQFDRPVRLVWGMRDPILGRALPIMQELFAQAQVTQTSAGHFLQEEVPGIIADAILGLACDLSSTVNRAAAS